VSVRKCGVYQVIGESKERATSIPKMILAGLTGHCNGDFNITGLL